MKPPPITQGDWTRIITFPSGKTEKTNSVMIAVPAEEIKRQQESKSSAPVRLATTIADCESRVLPREEVEANVIAISALPDLIKAVNRIADRMHAIAGAYMNMAHGGKEIDVWKAISEAGPDMACLNNAALKAGFTV